MPSYIAEEQRGTEARILNVLFPTILQGLQLTHQAADQFGARPQQLQTLPMGPRMEHRPVEYQQQRYVTPDTYAQLAADRSFMDVAAVLMPVVQAIIPPLVEQLLSFGPPKADTDQNEEDRFLQFVPQLVGTITPIMTQVLPGLLQNMRGMRAEHPVRITDRELNQRFFGPILQATLPAIIAQLPELLAITHGDQRSPVRYERMPGRGPLQLIRISRNDLVNAHRLRDGDVVYLTETPAPPGTTEVRVSMAPHGLWWKGVQVTDDGDRQICFVETNGDMHATFESRSVQTGGTIVLWKAKMFGIHTPMYVLPTGDLSPDGKCFTFHWAAD
ncbi:hypothetical protein SAMN05444920_108127 [Nonomuraea solani]|uniref:Uncharacterized protein n=1 Tax=Nonomuraea solani TaxID=1144553 RepID=A0A1H6E9E7_9ACTN|nr:hypothetical protein [Nonomuraea solani]SEG93465.1 hypothetical protein SAMN05444920_108127 [Nonomuraea solani]